MHTYSKNILFVLTNNLSCCFRLQTNLVLASNSFGSLSESVLETASHSLQVAHATRSLTSATRTLQSPVVYPSNHLRNVYSDASWHRDIRKSRSGSSECGRHDDRIFCRWCASLCVSYRKKKYP